ncbi:MAG TPA: ABC transporter ATP-binding protein [Symbiobacteriaceae bacterium]|jgi:ABC-type multidrug transport system fused ATPase/permease subunit
MELLQRYLRPQWFAAVLTAGFLLAGIALQLAGPRLLGAFLDAIKSGATEARLSQMALVFLGVTAAAQAVRVTAAYWSERVAWTAANGLRLDLTAHILGLDAAFHKERTPGELIERVDGDVSALAGFFSSFVVQLLGNLLLLAGILVSLALVNVWLGLAFAAFVLPAGWVLGRVREWSAPAVREHRERVALFYGFLGEAIVAGEDIRASGAEPYIFDRFFSHLRGWLPVALKAEVAGQLVWVTAVAALSGGTALAYGLGGGLYRLGAIPLGTVYMVVAYAAALGRPIEAIRTQLQNLQRAGAAIARVTELLALRSRLSADGTGSLPAGSLAVEFRGVSFAYEPGEKPVLDGLTFRLEAGARLGILGRTGSGKSTIARLMFRLYDPAAGEVRLGGVNVAQAGLKEVRSRVGLVTQEVQLFAASLRENITLFDPEIPDARITSVLETLGLKPWLERLPAGLETPVSAGSLSAGEAQLLAFARVFLRDPGLVILDEASSRLDPATEALLDRAMQRLLAGRTAVIIAHRPATVAQVDEILVLDGGRILTHGPRAEVRSIAEVRPIAEVLP